MCAFTFCQEPLHAENGLGPQDTQPTDGFNLRPKPLWLRSVTKPWQWVALDPNVYHPPMLDPLDYPAIIEHEKVHLSQQREMGKYAWFFRYIFSKNFRLAQELEPIVTELSNMPLEKRAELAARYARDLSGSPYHRAAKSTDLALNEILSKAYEMGVEIGGN
jgi:hypothetical protein